MVQMKSEEALRMIKQLIAEEGGHDISEIDSSKGLVDYIDSLDLVDVLGGLEADLGICIEDSDMVGIHSIDRLAEKIVELVEKKQAG
jgi:acyl carrier protein